MHTFARPPLLVSVAIWACAARQEPDPVAPPPAPSVPAPVATPVAPQPLPHGSAEAAGLDLAALARLRERAEQTGSNSLVVMVDGVVVVEEYFGEPREPIEAMSATKSIVALAIGRLIDDGKIASLDAPVHTLFPEWNQGRKRDITVRHLLQHTSGLQNAPNTTLEIYPSPDFVELALAAELEHAPGTAFSYNNKAVNLLAGVVEVASGQRMDRYIGEKIFAPLGITEFGWTLDGAGNPHGMSGLQIHALDLARIGQLVLQRGVYDGKRVVSAEFLDAATTLDATRTAERIGFCGLLWWLIPASASKPAASIRAYAAIGYLGQYLVIVPDSRIVAVRQQRGDADPEHVDEMADFMQLVLALR
jgi:CubicO group peptidase (beta-lactamase class C family)